MPPHTDCSPSSTHWTDHPTAAIGAVVLAQISVNVGAAFSKTLFPLAGPNCVAAMRTAVAMVLLLCFWRPWRHFGADIRPVPLLLYGATLGLMNLLIYHAIARIPLGIAVSIELCGPLAVALMGMRRRIDILVFALAVLGLWLLMPRQANTTAHLDPYGVLFAVGAAACWALYIVAGKRVARLPNGVAVSWGMVIACLFTVPAGLYTTSLSQLTPHVLALGLAVGILSSAIPYSLEMLALKRISAAAYGIFSSSAPAIAALAAWLLLNEQLTLRQWLAIVCIIIACMINALSHAPRRIIK